MFGFLTKKAPRPNDKKSDDHAMLTQSMGTPIDSVNKNGSILARLRQKLNRTSAQITDGLSSLILSKKKVDADLLEELETRLLTADLGVDATQAIIDKLTERTTRKELRDINTLLLALRKEMIHILSPNCQPLVISKEKRPYVILMVGVNGVGKTTTIGKLAQQFKNQGQSVMLAAGDTFRSGAVDQLRIWGERNKISVISQHNGADSASVIFDALAAAKARKADILIADTAGRLHTQANLMEELKKIKRVMAKLDNDAPHEIMLVIDASTGQNALAQTLQFNEAVGVSGITLTKLDGTAKGGIIFCHRQKNWLANPLYWYW